VKRTLLRSPAFGRDLRKWLKSRPDTAASIEATLEQLSADAAHPSLRTHKLRGPLAGCWACSAGYDLRVVFEFTEYEGAAAILLLALGTDDEVYEKDGEILHLT
jgi:mRNA interferase YafQ